MSLKQRFTYSQWRAYNIWFTDSLFHNLSVDDLEHLVIGSHYGPWRSFNFGSHKKGG